MASEPMAPVAKMKPSIAPEAKPLRIGIKSCAMTTIKLWAPPDNPPAAIARKKANAPS